MKKWLAFLLALTVVFSALSVVHAAEASEELVKNGGLEIDYWNEGDPKDPENLFALYGPAATLTFTKDAAHTGEKGLLMTDRKGVYSTFKYDAGALFAEAGTGKFRISLWLKLAPDADPATRAMLVVNYAAKTDGTDKYITSSSKKLTGEWQEFVIEKDFKQTDLGHLWIYPQVENGEPYASFCMDDLSVVKLGVVGKNELGDGGGEKVKASEELLKNGGLETDYWTTGKTDDPDNFFALYGPTAKMTFTKEAAHTGEIGLLLSEREGRYSTFKYDATQLFLASGTGKYRLSVWLKLAPGADPATTAMLAVNYTTEPGGAAQYMTSASKKLTEEWQEFVIEKDFKMTSLSYLWIYPQVENGAPYASFCMDDLSMVKLGTVGKNEMGEIKENNLPESEELLINGDFEKDYWNDPALDPMDEDNHFALYGPDAKMTLTKDAAHGAQKGLLLSERQGVYSTFKYDATDTFVDAGTGRYRLSVWLKLAPGANPDTSAMLVINYSTLKEAKVNYITTTSVKLTEQWQKFTIERNMDMSAVTYMWFYPQVESKDDYASFCMDDMSFKKLGTVGVDELGSGEKIDTSLIDVTPEKALPKLTVEEKDRQERTAVGAIRWDAWYGTDVGTGSVCKQVTKTLSPAKYHFRAPYYAEIKENGDLYFPAYTQEIFDQEMQYAIDAGIDYFAYNFYNDEMRAAREMHEKSEYRNQVKMCVILVGNSGVETKLAVAKMLQEDYYMTVAGGRPLMYYFGDVTPVRNDIAYYRALCKKLGLPMPYAVALNLSESETARTGADAIGQYAVAGKDGQSYESLTKSAQSLWKNFKRSGMAFVPTVTTGWHAVTRYENPVYWITSSADNWAEYATAEEIGQHLTDAINFVNAEENRAQTPANTVLMYAWNEHDEGGWICPTLNVDEAGALIKENPINTDRLMAVKQAIADYKASLSADDPEDPADKNHKFLLPAIIGGSAVLIGAAAAIILTVKGKKKHEEH